MKRYDKKEKNTLAVYLSIFILLVAGIALAGYISYRGFEQQFRAQAGRQLSSIAELKVGGLVNWRQARMADANMLYQNHAFATLVQAYFENPNDLVAESQIQDWLKNYQENSEYSQVRLMDAKGQVHLSFPIGLQTISSDVAVHIPEVLQSKQMTLFDFYRTDTNKNIRLSLLVPIMDVSTNKQVIGLVAISIDPKIYLYPFIEEWPVDSASAETLLVRRDGNDVLYLNEIRFNPNAALVLRLPLTDTTLPAVKAALGQTRVVEGIDYRGEQVLADVRPVPDSPWFLVSKMDTAEVYAPLRARLWQTLGLVGMAIFVAGLGLLAVWRQQHLQMYRAQAEAAEALIVSETRYRRLFEAARDGILILNAETGIILDVNPFLIEMLGFSKEVFLSKAIWELGFFKDIAANKDNFLELQQKEYIKYEGLPLETADGRNIQVEFVSHVYQVDQHKVIQCNIRDITNRVLAEEALRESERQLKETQFIAGLGAYMLNFASGMWTSSDVLDSIFGIDEKYERSIAGWSDLIHPADRQHMTDYFSNEVTGKHLRFDKEYRIVRKNDRAERWVHGLGELKFDAQNQLISMLGTIQDITARKQVDDALHKSEESLRLAVSASRMGTWDRNFISGQLEWSVECKAMFGLAPEIEVNDERFVNVLHPEDRAPTDLAVREALEKHIDFNMEYRVIWPDGTLHWIASQGRGYYNAAGQAIHMAGITFDITDRKQADEALIRSERKYRQLHESLMDGFVSVDMDGNFLECNEIYRNMLGYSEAELAHLTYIDLTPEKWHEYEKDVVQKQIIERGYSDIYEKEYCRKDRTIFPVELHTVLGRDEHGKPSNMWAIVRDITERKRAEQQLADYAGHLEETVDIRTLELRNIQDQLVRQERLATLGQLAGSIGHELRNPLGVISNAIYFLKMAQPDASDQVKEYLTIIEKEARTSDKIITDLLDFTRLKPMDREAASVSTLIHQTLERFPAPPSVEVVFDIPDNLPNVYVDPQQMIQVLGNLTVNACQAMPSGGKLSVSSRQSSVKSDALITANSPKEDNWLLITIQDTGVGIPLENMKKLFEPLFTTKIKGIGLGLAVSQKLAEANGGRIQVESEAGVGSTFTVWLPIQNSDQLPVNSNQ